METKFTNRFIDFFLVEQRLRWNVYLASVGIASAWAALRFFFSHKNEEAISLEAAILVCLLVAISVVAYTIKGKLLR